MYRGVETGEPGEGGGGGSVGIVRGGYLGGTMLGQLGILGVVGGRGRVGGKGLLGIGGSMRSAAPRRDAVGDKPGPWLGTGRVVARSGTPEGDIGPDGAECLYAKTD